MNKMETKIELHLKPPRISLLIFKPAEVKTESNELILNAEFKREDEIVNYLGSHEFTLSQLYLNHKTLLQMVKSNKYNVKYNGTSPDLTNDEFIKELRISTSYFKLLNEEIYN